MKHVSYKSIIIDSNGKEHLITKEILNSYIVTDTIINS